MIGRSLCLAALGLVLSSAAAAAQRVAVVVGVTDYATLPDTANLPESREDVRALARFLEERGGYDQVHVLLDAVATRDALNNLVRGTVAPSLRPGDTLLWVFVGQGFGGDFGNPYLLLYDSQPEDPSTAVDFYSFTRDLLRRAPGANVIVITDASHGGEVGGVALIGPDAKSLANLPGAFFALSATGPREVSEDGVFLPQLQAALQGRADANADKFVSAGELHRHLLEAVARASKETAHPVEAGSYDTNLIVSVAGGRAPLFAASGAPDDKGEGASLHWGGPLSYGLLGAGAVVAGSLGLYGNLRARSFCDVGDGAAECYGEELQERYLRARSLSYGAYAAGAVIAATGVGLGFVPLSDGAWLEMKFRF